MDPATALGALTALAAVLALVLLSARLLRRFAPGAVPSSASRRLKLIEVLPLDTRRRLLLLSCDGRQILLLTGGPQDLVIPQPETTP